MPVKKVGSKWAIGSGKPMYTTKAAADRAYKGYIASKSKPARQAKRKVKK